MRLWMRRCTWITMRRCGAYMHDPNTALTFDFKVKFIGFSTYPFVRPISGAHIFFILAAIFAYIFGTWVYHHEKMCLVRSWSRYDIDLWPQCQICGTFDLSSCPAHNMFGTVCIMIPIHVDWPLIITSNWFLTCLFVRVTFFKFFVLHIVMP